MGDGEIPVKG